MTKANAAPADEGQVGITDESDITAPINFLFEWNAGITRFYLHRYQQYWTLPFRVQSCRSPEDIKALQADFVRELFGDYRREAARLSKLSGAAGEVSQEDRNAEYAAHLLKAQEDAAAIIDQAKAQADAILASAEARSEKPAPKAAAARKSA